MVYVMTRVQHVFGRGGNSSARGGSPAPYVDTFLNAPDILPRHCTVRADPECPATVRPSRGAPVTHNGCLLLREAELHPGDLLGLGEHFLFMYKDPRAGGSGPARPPWLPARPGVTPPGPGWAFSCRLCGRGLQERGEALAAYLDGREPVLRFRPREEEALLGEIVRTAAAGAGDLPPLGPATLLALCVQHSARDLELGHLPRLLGRLARLIKESVWVSERPPPPPSGSASAPGPWRSLRGATLHPSFVTTSPAVAQEGRATQPGVRWGAGRWGSILCAASALAAVGSVGDGAAGREEENPLYEAVEEAVVGSEAGSSLGLKWCGRP